MIKISPLFSGSKGNCTLIQSDNANILLDLGYGYKQILSALARRNLTPSDIDGIVITHEHSDHICALQYWARRYNTSVFVPNLIADYVSAYAYCGAVTPVNGGFAVKDIDIAQYECSHDSRCCYGYRFTSDGQSVASVTDTGKACGELAEFLAPCTTVQLESNHDEDMLFNGRYPYFLKRRIASDFGHLSNRQAAEILTELVGGNVKNIILAHLSEQNNTKELAFNSAVKVLKEKGLVEGRDVSVFVADQYCNGITL